MSRYKCFVVTGSMCTIDIQLIVSIIYCFTDIENSLKYETTYNRRNAFTWLPVLRNNYTLYLC